MTTHYSPKDLKESHIQAMGTELGTVFYDLYQQNCWLHMKWNEFEILFNESQERVDLLNQVAPDFTWMLQTSWMDDITLHVYRLSDRRSDVISVHTLKRHVKVAWRDELDVLITRLEAVIEPVSDLRNRVIAHRNRELALEAKTAKPLDTDWSATKRAMQAIDDILGFMERRYCQTEPTFYGALTAMGGASDLVFICELGLRARSGSVSS